MARIKNSGRYVLFTSQRNEGRFIMEWIAYHKVIGFTDIIVFSNDCTDGSDELLDFLASEGEIQHFKHTPTDLPPQQNAEKIAREKGLFQNGDWVIWLDLDEYLYVRYGDHKVQSLVERIEPAEAIGINWLIFGDAGVDEWPGLQLSEPFVKCSRSNLALNRQIKTLFQYNKKIQRLDIHRPVYTKRVRKRHLHFVSSSNEVERTMPFRYYLQQLHGLRVPVHQSGKKVSYDIAQINHYMVRSPDVFQEKMERGRGYALPDDKVRHNQAYYKQRNRNSATNKRILRFEKQVALEMRRLAGLLL